jgi:diguanylate cyclase (GGDEF)-like protein
MPSYRTDDEWINLVYTMLSSVKIPDATIIDPDLEENPNFRKLWAFLEDLRTLSHALSKGDLQKFAYSKGFVLSNLKALQANLRHITWQTKQISKGDFSQKIEFLGEFSDSFNEMSSKLEESTKSLLHIAGTDFLTQLPNRRSAIRFLERTHALFKRHDRPYSVVMLDVDHFKSVNDVYGHNAGDRTLQIMSASVKDMFRETDMFARFGGEEFIAVLPETDVYGAVTLSEKIRAALENTPIELDDGTTLYKTVSVGAGESDARDCDYSKVINRSDEALYRAKSGGRNMICTSPPIDVTRFLNGEADKRRSVLPILKAIDI